MNHKDFMTKRQAEEKMECLREVFDVVRLVDGKMLKERSECLENIEPCQCYSVWNKQEPVRTAYQFMHWKAKHRHQNLNSWILIFSRYLQDM